MATPTTTIEILDSSQNYVGKVISPYELNKRGDILQYTKELSHFGTCRFRVSAYDTLFNATQLGDVLQPHRYHVRINRGGQYIWQGAIIENTRRNKDFIEVLAVEYEWYLNKILVNRTSADPTGNGQTNIYRIFNSGTMASAVTTIMNETITNYKNTDNTHPLANLTIGTVDNPNYPPNMQDGNNPPHPLSGPWSFGNGVTAPILTFDFHTIGYILKAFGAYTYADYGIVSQNGGLVFNFRSFYGTNHRYDVNFTYGKQGNAVDFNLPRLGQQMSNDIVGIATDNNGVILHSEQSDQASIHQNGIIQTVAAYSDVKDQASLNARIAAELPLISNPSDSPVSMVLSEQSYPLGNYDIGDIVTANVNHTAISYSAVKRIVGISVSVHNTGRELTTVQMNTPQSAQYGT